MRLIPCAALVLAVASCGTDVSISFRSSSGTIVDDAPCDGDGDFPLREESGLIVLVVVDGDTDIRLASGFAASCDDLVEGVEASVRGPEEGGRIRADEIEILG